MVINMTCTTSLYTGGQTDFIHGSDMHEKIIPGLGSSPDSCADTIAEAILPGSRFNLAFDVITGFRNRYTAELEIEQANAILGSSDPRQSLKDFAYFPNYIKACQNRVSRSRA